MRFQLNFAAVNRNVAVMANVVSNAVEQFVAAFCPVNHGKRGHESKSQTGKLRLLTRSDWYLACSSFAYDRFAATNLAYAMVSSQDEITHRWQHGCLMPDRRHGLAMSYDSMRG